MWEVDPETKSKLLALQKKSPNAVCVDCSAAQPQWATPKFGTFICLECAGIHRGLGVHVSFVRSVQMDSFKVNEVKRMEEGGNEAWRTFWDGHADGGAGDKDAWARTPVADRYNADVGEEYKERLSAKVEGREYKPVPKKPAAQKKPASNSGSGAGTPVGRASPGPRTGSPAMGGQKARNEAYFAKMGAENASRPDDVPPNQGGKYGGFGSSYELPKTDDGGIPGVDDFQKDPMAALTKGFGWFTTTVGKQAKNVNDGWIQPGLKNLNESDLAAQARIAAANAAAGMQKGAKGAADSFNKFVEGDEGKSNVDPEKKDFWDSFGTPEQSNSSIGTRSLMGGKSSAAPEKKDFWDSFGVDAPASSNVGAKPMIGGSGPKKTSALGTSAVKKSDEKGESWNDDF